MKSSDSCSIKIKMSNPNDSPTSPQQDFYTHQDEDIKMLKKKKKKKRICNLCDITFTSKKEFRRHVKQLHESSHAYKEEVELRASTYKEEVELRDSTYKEEVELRDSTSTTCALCGKTFLSKKALFGHMRCHPERDWRGINPPTTPPPLYTTCRDGYFSVSTISEEDPQVDVNHNSCPTSPIVDDLISCISNWSATARRGRRALKEHESKKRLRALDNGLMKVEGAAQTESRPHLSLCLEEDVENVQQNSKKRKEIQSVETADEDVSSKKLKIDLECKVGLEDGHIEHIGDPALNMVVLGDGDISDPALDKVKGYGEENCSSEVEVFDLVQENQHIIKQVDTECAAGYKDWGNWENLVSLGVPEKKRTTVLVDYIQSIGENKFKCDICGKCFPCHQALGGHKASHKKVQNSGIFVGDAHHNDGTDVLNLSNIKHQCKQCTRSFDTGQALGGHMRLHRNAQLAMEVPIGITSPSWVTSQEQVSSNSGGGRALGFDLNEECSEMKDFQGFDHDFTEFP